MKVLITGGSGFLGKMLVKHFCRSYDILTLGRNSSDNGGEHIIADLNNLDSLKLPYVELVIHAAGKAHSVPKSETEKRDFFTINYEGTLALLNALTPTPPKAFVFISTISVYGLDEGENISESFALNASEPYGLSKIKAEEAVVSWGEEHNVTTSILRLPLIAGPNPPGNLGNMIKAIASGKYFSIGEAKAKKSIVLAQDVAEIIPVAAEVGGIYNLTDGYHPSFSEIESAIAHHVGKRNVPVIPKMVARLIAILGDTINLVVRRRMFPLDSRAFLKITGTLTMDDSKARRALGWKPKKVLEHLFEK